MGTKIEIKEIGEDRRVHSIPNYMENRINRYIWGSGRLEAVEHKVDKLIDVVAALCEVLIDKNVISVEELLQIAGDGDIVDRSDYTRIS